MVPSCHFAELRYFRVAPLITHAHVPVLINDVAGRFADLSMRQNDVVRASLENLVEKFVHCLLPVFPVNEYVPQFPSLGPVRLKSSRDYFSVYTWEDAREYLVSLDALYVAASFVEGQESNRHLGEHMGAKLGQFHHF